jgi:hypothetical protein
MAINDWLTPQAAPLQPSFLTSRAAGAVLPEYFSQASEIAKTQLGLAGQQQNLRINESQEERARRAEDERLSARSAAENLTYDIANLDVNDPDYYSKLYNVVKYNPNALTDRSMSEFLGLQRSARGEFMDQKRFQDTRKAQEDAAKAAETRAAEREERQFARQTAKSMYDYAENLGLKVDDPSFAMRYMEDLKNYDKLDDMQRTQLQGRINLDYSQKVLADQLTALQIDPDSDEAEKYKISTPDGKKIFSANKVKIKAAQAARENDDRKALSDLLRLTAQLGAAPTAEQLKLLNQLAEAVQNRKGAADPYLGGPGNSGKLESAK